MTTTAHVIRHALTPEPIPVEQPSFVATCACAAVYVGNASSPIFAAWSASHVRHEDGHGEQGKTK